MKILDFFTVAEAMEAMSRDLSTKVGAVALDDDLNVLSTGYNGMPRKVFETEERKVAPLKYKFTCHAEMNLVSQAARKGVSLQGSTVLITTLHPCTTCSGLLIQAGVKRIIFDKKKVLVKWEEEEYYARQMLLEAGVIISSRDELIMESSLHGDKID
jgi:dCMP deaminase